MLDDVAPLLRTTRDDLRTTIDALPILVWRGLPDGSVEFLNKRWLDYTGLSMEEGCGWGWQKAIHPEDLDGLMQTCRRLIAAGEPGEHEARLKRFDGEYRWFLFRAEPLRDEAGGVVRWCGTTTDIEDRKWAQTLLAGENRTLEMIAQGDPLSRVLDQLCRLADQGSPGSMTSLLLLDPENRLWHAAAPKLPRQYVETFNGLTIGPCVGSCGTAAYLREAVIVYDIATDPLWAEYRTVPLSLGLRSCWSTPIFSSGNKVLGTFAIVSREPSHPTSRHRRLIEQITQVASIAIERSRAEEALQEAQSELAHVTRKITLGELATSIAHEVNQPLAAIVTNGEAGLHGLDHAPAAEETRQILHEIVRDAVRASDVIRRIRDLTRKAAPQKSLLDVNDVIGEVIPLVRREASGHRVALRLDLAPGLAKALVDRVQLQQVIINLIVNGIESMQLVADRPRELVIGTRANDEHHVLVEVQDVGTGVAPENAGRLFDAFFTTKPDGLGMGLSIVRSVIEAHGGQVWATPNGGQGTRFQFTLPTHGADSA